MKKKNKKERIPFKVLWSNPFYNSIIKLGGWLIFFAILYVFLAIGSSSKTPNLNNNKNKEEEVKPKISYIEMKNELKTQTLSINYSIGDYIITGLIKDNVLTGTLEGTDILYKIKYDGEKIYQVKKDEEIENEDILNDINKDYLLPSKIIALIDNPKIIGIKSADELTYSYNVNNVAISTYLNERTIEKIIILDGTLTYNLEYIEVVNEK